MSTPARILVVDDDPSLRDVLEAQLTSLGYEVFTAGSGEAALQLADTAMPDIVLSDVNMGAMTGVELCAQLKRDPKFELMPVILITSIADRDARVAGLAAGADDFFAKPYDFTELRTRIASALRIKTLQDHLSATTRLLRTLLGRYVSEDVATEIVQNPERHLTVSGEKREITILFGDLRGFTTLSDKMEAHDVVSLLNVYLAEVVDAVFAYGGTLDKFRGDGVMAIFGAPVAHDDDPLRAVRCAVALQARLKTLKFPGYPDLQLHAGIGINTGHAIVGTIGSIRRMDYTAIGGEVNIAQRFEANAGPGQILITGSTYAHVKQAIRARDLGPLRVSGVSKGVHAFDVLALKGATARARRGARIAA